MQQKTEILSADLEAEKVEVESTNKDLVTPELIYIQRKVVLQMSHSIKRRFRAL
jgi:hypothetical protein